MSSQHQCKAAKGRFRSDDLTCFYTGLKLRTDGDGKNGFKASIEHLVPVAAKMQGDHLIRKNTVPCATCINGAIGQAPLKVKYALKDFFKGFVIHPSLSEKDKIATCMNALTIFLEPYKRHGHYVWAWKAYQGKKKVSKNKRLECRRELYDAYTLLLTKEEIAIGAYIEWVEEKA